MAIISPIIEIALRIAGKPRWIAWLPLGVYFLLLIIGAILTERRALRQIRRWARSQGVFQVVKGHYTCPFPTWEFTLWTFSSINRFHGVDENGEPVKLFGAYYAPFFGLFVVHTKCEIAGPEPQTATDPTSRAKLQLENSTDPTREDLPNPP